MVERTRDWVLDNADLEPGMTIADIGTGDGLMAFGAIALALDTSAAPAENESDFLRLIQRWKSARFPSTDEQIRLSPIANYSERDRLRLVQESGFVDIHLELHIDVRQSTIRTSSDSDGGNFDSMEEFTDRSEPLGVPGAGVG